MDLVSNEEKLNKANVLALIVLQLETLCRIVLADAESFLTCSFSVHVIYTVSKLNWWYIIRQLCYSFGGRYTLNIEIKTRLIIHK